MKYRDYAVLGLAGVMAGLSTPGMFYWALIFPATILFFSFIDRVDKPFVGGWLFSFAYFCSSLYWLVYVVHIFGVIPALVAWIPMALLAAYCALYCGLAVSSISYLDQRKRTLLLPVALVAFDVLRGEVMTGFPWNPWGTSLMGNLALLQGAKWVGGHGVALLFLLACSSCAALWFDFRSKKSPAKNAGILVVVAAAWFVVSILPVGDRGEGKQKIALIQGNIAQRVKWDPDMKDTTIHIYDDLTSRATADGDIDLIVWPETAMPFFFQTPGADRKWVQNIAANAETSLLFGAPGFRFEPGDDVPSLFNRAYLLNQDGHTQGHYDKAHLVPFGEYVPMENILFFVKKMVEGIGEFTPGTKREPLGTGALKTGVLICYEIIFPYEVAEFVKKGANVLVQITNDAWFGDTAAPKQHLAMAQLRAIETGLPVVRAANTGISAWINSRGRIEDAKPGGQRGYVIAEITPGIATPFVAVSSALHFGWVSCSFVLIVLLIRNRKTDHGSI